MAKTKEPTNSNVNNNSNVNTNNINVHLPKRTYTKRKPESKSYTKQIVGAILAIITAVCIYYLTNGSDNKNGSDSTTINTNAQPIQPNN